MQDSSSYTANGVSKMTEIVVVIDGCPGRQPNRLLSSGVQSKAQAQSYDSTASTLLICRAEARASGLEHMDVQDMPVADDFTMI